MLSILIGVFLGCALAWKRLPGAEALFAGVSTLFCGVILGFTLFTIPIERAFDRSAIAKYRAFKATVETARTKDKLSEMERAAILKDIAHWNQMIASERYWNSTVFDIWHVDEAANLPPLE